MVNLWAWSATRELSSRYPPRSCRRQHSNTEVHRALSQSQQGYPLDMWLVTQPTLVHHWPDINAQLMNILLWDLGESNEPVFVTLLTTTSTQWWWWGGGGGGGGGVSSHSNCTRWSTSLNTHQCDLFWIPNTVALPLSKAIQFTADNASTGTWDGIPNITLLSETIWQ